MDEEGYIKFEPTDELVFVEIMDGKIDLSLYFCNECGTSQELFDAVTAWAEDTGPVVIEPHFKISAIVDYMVDMHELHLIKKLDIKAKETIDLIRAEFQAQIDRIDAIEYQ